MKPGTLVEFRIRNSPWNDPEEGPGPVIGRALPAHYAALVRLLAANMPLLVPAARIAGELGLAEQPDCGKAVSRMVYKINAALRKQAVPWRVFSNRRGGYALVPDAAPPEPESGGELS